MAARKTFIGSQVLICFYQKLVLPDFFLFVFVTILSDEFCCNLSVLLLSYFELFSFIPF